MTGIVFKSIENVRHQNTLHALFLDLISRLMCLLAINHIVYSYVICFCRSPVIFKHIVIQRKRGKSTIFNEDTLRVIETMELKLLLMIKVKRRSWGSLF